jgi:hypothetical protein
MARRTSGVWLATRHLAFADHGYRINMLLPWRRGEDSWHMNRRS